MIGRMYLKQVLKVAAGAVAVASLPLARRPPRTGCILMYHRVADLEVFDARLDAWNVSPARFETHLEWVSRHARCVALQDLTRTVSEGVQARPVVALTFDDGFGNFHRCVLPLLKRYRLNASLFVVTGQVGLAGPYSFDRWALRNAPRTPSDAWRPITWPQLEECVSSRLVSVGSHSHRHLNALEAGTDELAEEAGLSRDMLVRHLGKDSALHYAYPYGSTRLGQVRQAYQRAVRRAGYDLGVTTDPGLAGEESPRYGMPRVEVSACDGPAMLRAKVEGNLWPQRLGQGLRSGRREG